MGQLSFLPIHAHFTSTRVLLRPRSVSFLTVFEGILPNPGPYTHPRYVFDQPNSLWHVTNPHIWSQMANEWANFLPIHAHFTSTRVLFGPRSVSFLISFLTVFEGI